DFATPSQGGDGRLSWITGFELEEGFTLGSLNEQEGWSGSAGAEISAGFVHEGQQAMRIASAGVGQSPHYVEQFFGTGGEKTVWVTMHVRPQPGRLPDPAALEGPRSALVAVNAGGYLFAYDG